MNKRFRWDTTYLYWGITAFAVIACGAAVYLIMDRWAAVSAVLMGVVRVFSPIIYGTMFAYILNRMMMFFENRRIYKAFHRLFRAKKPMKSDRLPRSLSVVLTIFCALLLIVGLFMLVIPQLIYSMEILVTSIPSYLNQIVGWVQNIRDINPIIEDAAVNYAATLVATVTDWIQNTVLSQAETVVTSVLSGAYSVIMTIANILIGLVLSIFLLFHKEAFLARTKKIIYAVLGVKFGNKFLSSTSFLDRSCGSFITARLIDALIVGVLCYIFMAITGMPYAMLISVIIGITNIIPFFGPFIGAIPSAFLILLVNPMQCLVFVIFIIVLQQIDGNVIYPRIQGTSLGLSGFWIIVSLLVFSGFFGFWGMLLGVPFFTVVYSFINSFASRRLAKRGLPVETEEYKEIHSFDCETKEPILKSDIPPVAEVKKKPKGRG